MCGRYYIASEDQSEELRSIIAEVQRRSKEQVKLGEVYPTQTAPVIANNKAGKPVPFAMRWGFTWNGALLINARSETAAQKSVFRESMERRRCLIPASCYYEWAKTEKERVKYAVGAGKMIYMAGLYRMEDTGPVFTILTREPAEKISFIHNRMPVILPVGVHAAWLNAEISPTETLSSAVLDVHFKVA